MKYLFTSTIAFLLLTYAAAQVILPYITDFESSEGYVDETPLSGDWTTTDTSIVTADDVAQSGTQSVRITSADPENIISLRFDPSGNSILFVDYYMQFTASMLPSLPSITSPETTSIIVVQPYLSDLGEWVFWDGNGLGGGEWFAVGEAPLNETGLTGWHRITLRFDLDSNSWDAFIDGNLLAVNLGFVEAFNTNSAAINIYGNSAGVAYMDTFSLTTSNPLFTDLDQDGMDDSFEAAYGLNNSINDRDLDPDSDGFTNIEEYAYSTNPLVSADSESIKTIRDEFEVASVSNNDGTVNWVGDWLKLGETNGPSAGHARISFLDGDRLVMRIKESQKGWERAVDLSEASSASLSLLYRRSGLNRPDDYVSLSVSSDGGNTWTEVDIYAGEGTDSDYVSVTYQLEDYLALSADMRIRFLSSPTNGIRDRVFFDDVTITYTEEDVNDALVITSVPITVVDEGSSYSYTITATGADDSITFIAQTLPEWLSFDGITLSGVPGGADVGDHAVEIVATDASGATDTQSFTVSVVSVNEAPFVDAGVDQSVENNLTVNLDATVSDEGSYTVQWRVKSGPVGGVTFEDPSAVDTTATFTLEGIYVLNLTAVDEGGLSASDEVTVTVPLTGNFLSVRDEFRIASVSNNDGSATWASDWQEIGESNGPTKGRCLLSYGVARLSMLIRGANRGWSRAVDLSMANTAQLNFSHRRVSLETEYSGVILSVSSDGGATWVIVDSFVGPSNDEFNYVPVTYQLEDYIALTEDVRIRFLSNSSAFLRDYFRFDDITITYGNINPPTAVADNASTVENTKIIIDVLANDSDIDVGDSLSVASIADKTNGTAVINSDNTITFTPLAFFNGTASFTYEVEDSRGLKDTATVTVEVLPVNDAPVALFSYASSQEVPPFDVTFDGSDSYDDLAIVEYRWDFNGDGIVDSSVAEPQFQFDSADAQTVSLTVLDEEGLSDTQEQVLIFNQPPEVQIVNPDNLERFKVGETVNLLIEALDVDGLITTITLFDVEDNAIAQTTDPSVSLFSLDNLAIGTHKFVAKVTDNDGATGESEQLSIRVYKTPGDFFVEPLLLEDKLVEVSSEDSAEQNYSIRYSATDPELSYNFEDIKDTGSRLEIISTSDDASENVELSFEFPFYGQGFTSLYVGSNGLIVLGSSEVAQVDAESRYFSWDPLSLPSLEAPRNLIAPWWGDLLPRNLGAGEYGGGFFEAETEIYYKDFGDRLIIQYNNIGDYTTCSGPFNFQVVLYASGVIDFVYGEMYFEYEPANIFDCNPIGVAEDDYIVGLQNSTRDIGVQVDPSWRLVDSPMLRFEPGDVAGVMSSQNFFAENGYNQPVTYTITPKNNTVDALPDNPVWFDIESPGNVLNTGERDTLQVNFIANPGFPVGRYEGTVLVEHNQPGLDPYTVNVVLDIVANEPTVDWLYPVAPGYVLLGQSLPLEVVAEDENGFIQSLSIFIDDNLLVDFVATPYTSSWTPPAIGRYTLKAVATDNDGNVVESTFDLVVTEDSDIDGLPDQWELDFLVNMDSNGLDDSDNDSLSNLKELFLGTDPGTLSTGTFENLSPTISLSVTPDIGRAPLTITLNADGSIDRDGRIVSYEWDFDGDGTFDQTTESFATQYTYTEPGLYTLQLKITDDEGATATTTRFVRVREANTPIPPALIDFDVNVPVTGQLVDFFAASSADTDDLIVDYHWKFSDGLELSGARVQRHFMMNGRYSVTLTVTDSQGNVDVTTEWISVLGPNRSPGTVGDLWVVSGADYTYTMIDRDCNNWKRTRENSIYNFSGYETPINGFGNAAEVGYTFNVNQTGFYYLGLLKQNVFSNEAFGDTSGGGLDIYLDNKRISPDNGYYNEIDDEPTWGRYGRFYLEPGYHTIAFEAREDSYFEIFRLAIAISKDSLPVTGSVTQAPQVNSIENTIIPIPDIQVSSTADTEVVKLGEVVDLSLDTENSDLPNPVLHYFWNIPTERLNTIHSIVDSYVSNDPSQFRFAPSVLETGNTGLNRIRFSLIDSEGQTSSVDKYIQFSDPVSELSDPLEIIVDSEDVPSSFGWSEYKYEETFGGYVISRASGIHGATYLANGLLSFSKDSLNLPVLVNANTYYLAFYYIPNIEFYGLPDELAKAIDFEGIEPSSKTRVEYPSNGGRKSAFVDMRYQSARWNWFAVIDTGSASEIDLKVNSEEDNKHAAFDGLKLIPVETTDTADNQLPEPTVTISPTNDFTYEFDASQSTDTDGEVLGYLWHFGDGAVSRSAIPEHTYAETGSYEVTLYLLDDDLGLSEWSSIIEVSSNDTIAPFARLTSSSDQGTIPFRVSFSAELSTDDTEIIDYEIQFPDGSIVFDSEAEYVFTEPGEYWIKLTVRDVAGNESTAFRMVEAFAQGVTFNSSFVIEDSDVTATEFIGDSWRLSSALLGNRLNTVTTSSVTEDLALFNFTPEHSGLYQLFLAASYKPSNSCDLETEVNLRLMSQGAWDERSVVLGANENIDRRRKWNFAGTFDLAALTQTQLLLQAKPQATELSIDSIRWIPVDSGVVPDFTFTLDDRTEITVDASASTSPEGISDYHWNFGDDSEATGSTASHSYADAGLYTVTLTVTDAAGRKASASEAVRILPENNLPQIQLDVSSYQGTAPFKVSLDASVSTDADGRIVRYLWDFGDGRVGDGVSVQHNYVSPGTYTLTLTLVDDRGGQSSESVIITVQAPASGYTGNVTRSVETPIVDQSVVFDASTLVSDGSAFTYSWDFGDGTTSAGAQPSHAYTAPGVYSVSVVVTDENGLQTTQQFWVSVTEGNPPSDLPARNDIGTGLLIYPPFDTVQQP